MKWMTVSLAAFAAAALVGCGDDSGAGENTLAACGDGTDNDGDGYTDCNDQDCLVFSMCTSADADADADADTPADLSAEADAEADADVDVEAETDSPTVCAAAPGCAGAAVPGTIDTPLESLTSSAPPAGCAPTKLRVRLASVTVYDAQDAPEEDEIYCVTSALAPTGGEIRLLPLLEGLADGDTGVWSLDAGVLWGQAVGPVAAGGTLQVVIDCLESDDTAAWATYAAQLADDAESAGGVAGSSGWVFPAGIDVGAVVAGTWSAATDDHVFSTTVAIEEGVQFAATRGAWSAVRLAGGPWPNEWDWEVRLEVWGCTENGTLPR